MHIFGKTRTRSIQKYTCPCINIALHRFLTRNTFTTPTLSAADTLICRAQRDQFVLPIYCFIIYNHPFIDGRKMPMIYSVRNARTLCVVAVIIGGGGTRLNVGLGMYRKSARGHSVFCELLMTSLHAFVSVNNILAQLFVSVVCGSNKTQFTHV